MEDFEYKVVECVDDRYTMMLKAGAKYMLVVGKDERLIDVYDERNHFLCRVTVKEAMRYFGEAI